jgi:hypothetical protein
MRFNFPTLVLASAVLATAALAIQPALAETKTLDVPFAFTVNGQSLPAGQYTVQRDDNGNFLKLKNKDASQAFAWVASPSAARSNRVVLRFEHQGKIHALYSVQYGAMVTPRLDKKTKDAKPVIEEVAPSM